MIFIDKGDEYKIYLIRFPNHRLYIGFTGEETIQKRIQKGYNHNKRLTAALEEYEGEYDVFVLEDGLSFDKATQRERFYILSFSTTNPRKGYNKSEGGASGFTGCRWTAKQRKLLSGDNSASRRAAVRRRLDSAFNRLQTAMQCDVLQILNDVFAQNGAEGARN